eukprot:g24716.t1
MAHINTSLPTCLNPLLFAYRHNRSTEDAISLALYSSLEHLDNEDIYVRLLLIDYSSTFNTIIPFRLISKLMDIEGLVTWCNENNLSLNVDRTKELIIDFRKKGGEHTPIYINGTEVERMKSIKFLGVMITDNMSWPSHVNATVKKVQQRLFFLRRVRKFGMSIRSLTNFYRCTIESVLSGCITAWYSNCSAQDSKKLQKVVCTAQ